MFGKKSKKSPLKIHLKYLLPGTFASYEWASHQRYQDDSGTDRKLMNKSTILEGQAAILSHPGYVYKPIFFIKKRYENEFDFY